MDAYQATVVCGRDGQYMHADDGQYMYADDAFRLHGVTVSLGTFLEQLLTLTGLECKQLDHVATS